MNDETPATQESVTPEPAPPNSAPEPFREYVKWRNTGVLPEEPEQPTQPAAAEETPQAKTEPQSGADETQTDEGEQEEHEEPEGTGRRGGSRQRKIDKLTRENELLKQQLAARAQPPAETPKPQPPPGKPRLETFETLEDYQEALTDWNITQREQKRAAEAEAKAQQEAQQKIQTEWDSKKSHARKIHRDFDDVIDSVPAPVGPGVADATQAMLEDEAGAEILYYLATHPEDIKRIAAMNPNAAVREIGRLSAMLSPSTGTANGKQKFSSAPKPPPPNTRPAKPTSDSIDDPAVANDFRKWSKLRRAQLER